MTRAENEENTQNRGPYYMFYLIQNHWALIANHDGKDKSLDEMLNSKKSL